MIRCQHCGQEVEEGRAFCPHCGQSLSDSGGGDAGVQSAPTALTVSRQAASGRRHSGAGANSVEEEPRASAPLPAFGSRGREETDKSRRTLFIAVALGSALLVAGLVWFASRPSARTGDPQLESAVRPGSPEFEQIRDLLRIEFDPDEDAVIGPTALGTYAVTMRPTVRNFTGRTVSGLEFHASGLDLDKRIVRERTFVWQQDIEPNKVSAVPISINFPQDNRPASLDLKLTGVKFK
ncbi:MAG: zinc ribbon domain-containing protein [Acidobacteria bacterium]|nr:zinc ribbon domain-containing protein [Acidobacteriota bacterium]